jgi:hypothetical protein
VVDIVLTPDQIAAIGKSPGRVRFLTPDRQIVCESAEPVESSIDSDDECEPLSAEEVEKLLLAVATKDAKFSTTEDVIARLEAMRPSS